MTGITELGYDGNEVSTALPRTTFEYVKVVNVLLAPVVEAAQGRMIEIMAEMKVGLTVEGEALGFAVGM